MHRLGDSLRPLVVRRVHRRTEAVLGPICQGDHLLVGLEFHDEHNRAECLLLDNAHRVVDVGEQGGLEELAVDCPVPLAADHALGPLRHRVLHQLLDRLRLARHGHGALVGRAELWRALPHALDVLDDLLDELVVHRLLYVHPLDVDAVLTAVGEGAPRGGGGGRVQVAVLADDHGVLATELEDNWGEGLRRLGHDAFPVAGRSSEDDLVHTATHNSGTGVAIPDNELDEVGAVPGGPQCVMDEGDQVRARPGGPLGDLDNAGVAGVQGRDDLPVDIVEGVVPWCNDADHAAGLVLHPTGFDGEDARVAVRGLQVFLSRGDHVPDLLQRAENLSEHGVRHVFAGVARRDLADVLLVLDDVFGDEAEDLTPLRERRLGPALLGFLCEGDPPLDLGGLHGGQRAKLLERGRIETLDDVRGAIRTSDPLDNCVDLRLRIKL
mmetsp:Transcript_12855/g.22187  ORF Transcript_12855/g.22187 Transcript_12855/m.22187 type:complete len:438 (-) Transcript_12855:318-1631(-)